MSWEDQQIGSVEPLPFKLFDAANPNNGLAGLTVAMTIRKPGGSFASAAGTVSDLGGGIYEYTPASSAVFDTLGRNLLRTTAAGAITAEWSVRVVTHNPENVLDNENVAELGSVPAAAAGVKNMLKLLFMQLRNRGTADRSAGTATIQNDAGTTIATTTVTKVGAVVTKGEYV